VKDNWQRTALNFTLGSSVVLIFCSLLLESETDDSNPIAQASHHVCQRLQIGRFDKIGSRSHIECALHILAAGRSGQMTIASV